MDWYPSDLYSTEDEYYEWFNVISNSSKVESRVPFDINGDYAYWIIVWETKNYYPDDDNYDW